MFKEIDGVKAMSLLEAFITFDLEDGSIQACVMEELGSVVKGEFSLKWGLLMVVSLVKYGILSIKGV